MRPQPSVADYVAGVRAGDRALLARAITLIESRLPRHRAQASELLQALLPFTGGAHRVGISGSPGVGKSTFVEALGLSLLERGHRLAVLAIDPTSALSGGSVLGDKTRMPGLTSDPRAFVRPSPSTGTLGGVARATREALLLCEAAGFDVVLVETVGVGQSEALVAEMVDTFVLLLLAGAGDELQGIKRGVLELAEVLAVTKADGDNVVRAERAAAEYRHALRLQRAHEGGWRPPLLLVSSLEGRGIGELWEQVVAHRVAHQGSGLWEGKRARQRVAWLWSLLNERLLDSFRDHPRVSQLLSRTEAEVQAGQLTPGRAADLLLEAFATSRSDGSPGQKTPEE
ncbi:MAG: methylmalonyl Co-A mutase-associated GTPase MeaB [Planctomycetota bacterium]